MPRKNKDFGRNQLAPAVHPDHPSEALHTLTKVAWLDVAGCRRWHGSTTGALSVSCRSRDTFDQPRTDS